MILLTAKSEIDDRVLGLDSGADDYLGKPFDIQGLLARIRAITRRQKDLTDMVFKYGSVTLNRATFTWASPYGSLRLANKEFQMMEMLMNKPSYTISTEQLIEKIWGYDTETEINVVWIYVSYLRKKLAAIKGDIEIKALRNRGWCLL